MIFFGSGRFLLLPLLLFFVAPLFVYSPLAALAFIAIVVVIGTSAGKWRQQIGPTGGFPPLAPPDPRAFEDVRRTAEEDILRLADEIRSLDLDIEMPGVSTEARGDYMRAVDQYDRAKAALDRARSPRTSS